MPSQFEGVDGLDATKNPRFDTVGGPGLAGTDGSMSARTPKAKAAAGMQKQKEFLHKALIAIGTEIDEDFGPKPLTGMGIHVPKPVSARHRDGLRQEFASHSNAECEQLRRKVATREAEIGALRAQVDQLSKMVTATRAAAKRTTATRKTTRSTPEPPGHQKNLAISRQQGQLILNAFGGETKKGFMPGKSNSYINEEAAEMVEAALSREPETQEDIQRQVHSQWESEQAMRNSVEEQVHLYHRQTVQRKANEAGLFGKHAEILRLRSQALRAEGRVTRLANDLKRMYQQVPQVVQNKLEQSVEQFEDQKRTELDALNNKHSLQQHKWMDVEEIQDQIEINTEKIKDMRQKSSKAEKVLQQADELAIMIADRTRDTLLALAHLEQAWGKLETEAANKQVLKDVASVTEYAQSILKEARFAAQFVARMGSFVVDMPEEADFVVRYRTSESQSPSLRHRTGSAMSSVYSMTGSDAG